MPMNHEILLYSLAKTFNTILNIDICGNTRNYIKSKSEVFIKLEISEKMYYTKYSLRIAKSIVDSLEKINLFELNLDSDHEIFHDFRIVWKKDNIAHISMDHNTINTKNLIPEKLMKICKYKKNTNICKEYTIKYKELNDHGYKKIKSNDKYSEIGNNLKNSAILEPMCDLMIETLSKKRKCAKNLYNFLFSESDRIVLKLYKNRFIMYDFGKKLENVESYRMKLKSGNEIIISFNNGTKFCLTLQTNASEIKEHLSLKFHTKFKNIDDLFSISNCLTQEN